MAMFTILLVAGNTMAQAIRERTNELAVLKTLGFSDGRILALVLLESCSSRSSAAGSAWRCRARSSRWRRSDARDAAGVLLPDAADSSSGIGLVVGARDCAPGFLPAWQASRLRIVDALRRELMLSQIIAVTGVNLRSIRQRLGSSTVAVIGIAGVVIVFVGGAVDRRGLQRAMKASGDPRPGHDPARRQRHRDDERPRRRRSAGSSRTRRASRADAAGAPLTSPELFVDRRPSAEAERHRRQRAAARRLAGGVPGAHQLKIVEGRNFEPGKNEIIVGRAAARQFVNLNVGTTLKWGENTWKVVGIFEDGGSGRRVRAVVRREGAAAGLPPRQQLPVGLRAARVARLVPAAQGRADLESAADGHGDARAGLLRQPDRVAADGSSGRLAASSPV